MDGKFAHEFLGFGAMDGQFTHEFMGSELMDGEFRFEFIGFEILDVQLLRICMLTFMLMLRPQHLQQGGGWASMASLPMNS